MKSEEIKFKPQELEKKWQAYWERMRVYQPDLSSAKKPYYNLMMFPYPSAEGLHVGNMYAFTGADINGRYKRMRGYDVFEPIGLDGFGIHSENYAIKIGKHPAQQAKVSQENFYRQLHAIGNGFAWENTLETYDPDYYRWTQWIFVQMFKAGLAYRKKSPVNFCPSCKTVLSDEQVIDARPPASSLAGEVGRGSCERCKSTIEKRDMEQWYFRITKYAEKLLKNIETLEWTNKVKVGQRNWIGKKEGMIIKYQISNIKYQIECFTTRPDTNFGATFVVIAPEHPFVDVILGSEATPESDSGHLPANATHQALQAGARMTNEIREYVEKAKKKSEADRIAEGRKKTGVFTGFYVINQLNNYKMPIWISDFVLGNVGTGAVVGVPGHDMRDFEFAKEFKIPIIRVVVGKDGDKSEITRPEQVQEEEGTMINSGFLDGLEIYKAISMMMNHLEENGWGKRVVTYKLRDWCISRQRYWGAPIPMIDCPKCGWVPVPEDQLPVLLPANVKDWKPEGTGKGPLAKIESFVKVKCPNCKGDAKRETDVCDTFLDSSWYHLRYPSVTAVISGQVPWDPEITKKWLPVTQYIGGAEHTVLHLLYARFVAMVFKDLGKISFDEPYTRFYAHGLIIAEGAKMSKSKGNVVIPDAYIAKYGADTLRTYLMFLGPFDNGGDFRDTGIAGMYRFLSRVWRLVEDVILSEAKNPLHSSENGWDPSPAKRDQDDNLNHFMHKTIKEVTEDMENFRYNTAIAHIMEYVNQLTDNRQQITNDHLKTLILLLAPFAPHMCEELYESFKTNNEISIHLTQWPKFDPKFLIEDEVVIIIQVNGKMREAIKVKSQKSKVKSEVEEEAQKSEKIKKYLEGKSIRKTVFVPGELLNFVVY